jgi:hypothetical protein
MFLLPISLNSTFHLLLFAPFITPFPWNDDRGEKQLKGQCSVAGRRFSEQISEESGSSKSGARNLIYPSLPRDLVSEMFVFFLFFSKYLLTFPVYLATLPFAILFQLPT